MAKNQDQHTCNKRLTFHLPLRRRGPAFSSPWQECGQPGLPSSPKHRKVTKCCHQEQLLFVGGEEIGGSVRGSRRRELGGAGSCTLPMSPCCSQAPFILSLFLLPGVLPPDTITDGHVHTHTRCHPSGFQVTGKDAAPPANTVCPLEGQRSHP